MISTKKILNREETQIFREGVGYGIVFMTGLLVVRETVSYIIRESKRSRYPFS